MMSKEVFISWLNNHESLTADLEFDIHDCFEAALDAATQGLAHMPDIGFMSHSKRLESFYSVCRFFDGLIARGTLEITEALVALNILRAMDRNFRKAADEFTHQAMSAPLGQSEALPVTAREYLNASVDSFTPLVAG